MLHARPLQGFLGVPVSSLNLLGGVLRNALGQEGFELPFCHTAERDHLHAELPSGGDTRPLANALEDRESAPELSGRMRQRSGGWPRHATGSVCVSYTIARITGARPQRS